MPHHYETISDEVPHHYETIPDPSDLPHHYDTINDGSIYSKGKPADLTKYNWYHGNITEEQAEVAFAGYLDGFLVRHTSKDLILSSVSYGWYSHDIIHRSPEGYRLDGKEMVFKTVHEMIQYYKLFLFTKNRVLGVAADRNSSGMVAAYLQ